MKYCHLAARYQLILLAVCGLSHIALADIIEKGDTISGIHAGVGTSFTVQDNGDISVQNSYQFNGNVNGVVELDGGHVDLGTRSFIEATGGWGNPNLAAVAIDGYHPNSQFVANDLSIVTTTTPTAAAHAIMGIGSLYNSGLNTSSEISLSGTTIINVHATSSAALAYSTYGIYLDGSGITLNADKLNIDVLYQNASVPSNMGLAGILAVRNGQLLTYNQAEITVTNNTANTAGYGIQNAAAITGGDTTVIMKGGASNQTLVGIDSDTIDTNTKTGVVW